MPITNQTGIGQVPFHYPRNRAEQRRIAARLDTLRAKLDDLQCP